MNAYDFDNTIYDGESLYDFFLFCLKKDHKLAKFLPLILTRLLQYKFNSLKIEKLYELSEIIVKYILKKNIDFNDLCVEFWKDNTYKIKPEFLKMLKKDDLIITGCPCFLIDYVKDKLKVDNILCTDFDLETYKLNFVCLGENKIKAYKEKFGDKRIEKFYTDSLMDKPFMRLADEVYIVKKDKVIKLDKRSYM